MAAILDLARLAALEVSATNLFCHILFEDIKRHHIRGSPSLQLLFCKITYTPSIKVGLVSYRKEILLNLSCQFQQKLGIFYARFAPIAGGISIFLPRRPRGGKPPRTPPGLRHSKRLTRYVYLPQIHSVPGPPLIVVGVYVNSHFYWGPPDMVPFHVLKQNKATKDWLQTPLGLPTWPNPRWPPVLRKIKKNLTIH